MYYRKSDSMRDSHVYVT